MAAHRVYRSNYPPPQIPTNVSVSQLLQRYNPDDVESGKVICEDDWTGKKLTYSGIREESAKGAYGLRHVMGLREGDVVCICAPNSVEVVKLIHAVLWCGSTAVLINPLSTEYEIAHCLDISQPQAIAVDANTWPTVSGAVNSEPDFSGLKAISIDDSQSSLKNVVPSTLLFDQTESLLPFDLSSRDSRDHTAVVCFSSGTSGKAKGVELSHYNLVASILDLRATDPNYWNGSIRGVFFAPLCHIYGLMTVALMGTWLGSYTMLMKRYTLDTFLELSAKSNVTALRILPTIAVAIAKQQTFNLSRLNCVKYIMCSGAALPPAIITFFHQHFPSAPIFQGYGMTETHITMLKPESAYRIGSVGRLFANIEARVVDEEGKDVQEGEQGEMLVRGPSIFKGYMRNKKATREAFDGEWMRTGDILKIDKEGFWWLTERKKELIKYKGNQVAPAELEAILNSHHHVSEGAVCALWHEDQGTEVPIAYIALTPDAKASGRDRDAIAADVRKHVDAKVSPYKKLRGGVIVLDEIPKSGNGKVLRRMLPARLARERQGKL
ncbi:acyl-CoA synthetases/AMP-acid ligases II [Lindgomyces ingoldianus]|uniref:Acyl-CoA synthetases/AMP-acid ligases II n=1 Tax=Lindgomyces ingoldianus TaxID=673940 RepID=A0ACB6RDA5_9PLEO|nr:acyl-CoA synthetases/AMP-acid ligases II [Lindgomyces ingoldianus]KAF2476710.1 acyl-CoA synthetases/AMP-acid ligases II [Lindgomyces ingoldianus]